MSIKGAEQWQDLQSPLDIFARKHCPNRTHSHHSSSEGYTGGHTSLSVTDQGSDELGAPPLAPPSSPSWDRPNNHSPLAALLRREFPGGSERRLFDDLG